MKAQRSVAPQSLDRGDHRNDPLSSWRDIQIVASMSSSFAGIVDGFRIAVLIR